MRGRRDGATLAATNEDRGASELRGAVIDWNDAWARCRSLSAQHAATTGCRTLDALHVACAQQLGCVEFFTTDKRQAMLARKAGLRVRALA